VPGTAVNVTALVESVGKLASSFDATSVSESTLDPV
jgi:hypothetical protein